MERRIAYFSMEIALDSAMPTYSGGLGVLAGDTLRSAADLGVCMAGVTLLHRKGYFHQRLDRDGRQSEEPVEWSVDDFVRELPERVSVVLEGRTVVLRAWQFGWWREGCIEGVTGWAVGPRERTPEHDSGSDAAALHDKLEQVVAPMFYAADGRFIELMRHAIALNGSFFNTQRMVEEYVLKAYYA